MTREREFSLDLSAEERRYLLELVRFSISGTLKGGFREADLPAAPGAVLDKELGAFVTLNKNGNLRGCIGRIVGDAPLRLTVSRMAIAAAFHDPRFPALGPEEWPEISCEVSVLGPILPCREAEKIVVGQHGLIMKKGMRQGLLLPQVPVEWRWNREEFLRHTCAKAGLPAAQWQEAWKEGSGTELYWFEAMVYHQ
jgi:AmmeMemoRadiSam system protein A